MTLAAAVVRIARWVAAEDEIAGVPATVKAAVCTDSDQLNQSISQSINQSINKEMSTGNLIWKVSGKIIKHRPYIFIL